ncbi:MAG: CBS domain-containing protein [Desulfurococcales archaeon]|nr:CBS domain-containing protein [Desulfurococcales archaeon]
MAPRVSSYMTPDVAVVTPNDSLAHARRIMLRRGISRLVVVDENDNTRPVGVLTITDMVEALLGKHAHRPIESIMVREVYTPDPIVIESTRTIKTAASLMLKHKIGGLPVVTSEGRLVGIITRHDVTRAFAERYRGTYRVSDVMRRDFTRAVRGHSIYHIARLLMADPAGKVVVLDGDKPVGVITKRDLAFASIPLLGKNFRFYKVKTVDRYRDKIVGLRIYTVPIAEDIMTSNPLTIREEADAAEAADIMVKEDIGILPVVSESGSIKGVLTKLEILEAVAKS